MLDQKLFGTKHISLWLSTLTMGVGITFVPDNKSIHFLLVVFELEISFLSDED